MIRDRRGRHRVPSTAPRRLAALTFGVLTAAVILGTIVLSPLLYIVSLIP